MTAEEALSLMLEAGTDEAAWQVLQALTDEEVFELALLVSSLDREDKPS